MPKVKVKPGSRGGGVKAATLQPPAHSPPPAPRVAWPLGKISSNKDEAMARFLEKKRARGESLSEDQLRLIARFHAPEHAAAAQEVAAGAAPSSTASASAGHKRKRDDASAGSGSAPAAATAAPSPSLSLSDKLSMSLDDLSAAHRRSGGGKAPGPAAPTATPPTVLPARTVHGVPVSKKNWAVR